MTNINHQVVINVMPKLVYTALTSQEGISSWWNKETKANPQVGFVNLFKVKSTGEIHTHLKITSLIPDKRMEYECIKGLKEWVGTKIVFDLEEKDGTTVVRLNRKAGKKQLNFLIYARQIGYFI